MTSRASHHHQSPPTTTSVWDDAVEWCVWLRRGLKRLNYDLSMDGAVALEHMCRRVSSGQLLRVQTLTHRCDSRFGIPWHAVGGPSDSLNTHPNPPKHHAASIAAAIHTIVSSSPASRGMIYPASYHYWMSSQLQTLTHDLLRARADATAAMSLAKSHQTELRRLRQTVDGLVTLSALPAVPPPPPPQPTLKPSSATR